ncbi:MAG: VanW family protein [Syntrophomonas sp.]|nr:VanW family protein [Syntrophomonas sp.]
MERNVLGVKEGVRVEGIEVERLLPGELREVIEGIALQHQKLPLEPRLDKKTGVIIGEEMGFTVDVDMSLAKIQGSLPGENHTLEKTMITPVYNSNDLIKACQVIANYSTWFHGSSARYQNISAAIKSLNNTVIWPGEVFSFNENTGPRTPERGYLPAPIIINGGYDVGYGGGVCQVSSTVYNAALKAGLPIIERHNHSKPVHYVPAGQDATVDYGYLDLKWQNNRKGPLIMKTSLQNGRVYVELKGEK